MTDNQNMAENALQKKFHQLATAAMPAWGLTGDLSLIKYRENAVYRLSTSTGECFALRIHRSGYHSNAALLSELQWINALNEFGIGVPDVIKTKNGEYFTLVSVDGISEKYQVDLFEWVEGEQLGSVEDGLPDNVNDVRVIYQTIGRLAAKLHNQATSCTLPEGFVRHAWDKAGLVGDSPFWGPFWQLNALSDSQRRVILSARKKVEQELSLFGKTAENYSMIHADFVPENFLVDGDKVQIIDFDDAGFGWHLFDIATALYFIQDDKNYSVARTALIEGYRENRVLPEATLAHLDTFLVARSFTYLGWVHERAEEETAVELTPMLIDMCVNICEKYLAVDGK